MENFRIATVAQLDAVDGRAAFDEKGRMKKLIFLGILIAKIGRTVLIDRIDKANVRPLQASFRMKQTAF